jgi:trehalose synthase
LTKTDRNQPPETRSINQYTDVIGREAVDEIKKLASKVEGATITHVNSTRFGGGVAEILKSLVPLANSVGLKVKWQVMTGTPDFFKVTKSFHNGLQGMAIPLTNSMKEIYINFNRDYANELDVDSDVIFIHDPQPAALIEFLRHDDTKFLWRCHIDLTNANLVYWDFIRQFASKYDGLIFSLDRYVREDVSHKKIFIIPPSIDPLSDKNKPLSPDDVLKTLERFGLDPDRPIVTQVARFDYWKDPLGVIECYKLVKKRVPETQLLLVGSMPQDDPEGEEWYKKTLEMANGFADIHVLTDRDGVADIEVNAFQRATNVAIQKSLREGFSLSVTEALWKGTPVVATRAGGIPLQVIDGITGFLINGINDAADKIVYLLKRGYIARILGMEGREHIKKNFLITRHLRDYIRAHLEVI